MIVGAVSLALQAQVALSISNSAGNFSTVTGLVDTGFNGSLSLPEAEIKRLNLVFDVQRPGMLADGTLHDFNVYIGMIEWDGQTKYIEVDCLEGPILVGTQLLWRHELTIEFVGGGKVAITPLNPNPFS